MGQFTRETREAFKNLHDFAMTQTVVDPERLVVAGGAATQFARATDIDLWVLKEKGGKPATIDQVEQLATLIDPHFHRRDSSLGVEIQVVGAHASLRFYRPVQLLIADHVEAAALLDSFDISTHMVGYDLRDKEFIFGRRMTGLGMMALVHNEKYPDSALRRLIMIESRYNLPPNTKAKQRLRRLIDMREENDGSTETKDDRFVPRRSFQRFY